MTKENLNAVFANPYNRQDWQNLLREVFPGVTFFANPFRIPVPKEEIKEFFHTGNIRLYDGKNLAIFELQVSDKINLKRNRVTLHTIISKHIDQETHHGVLALFDSNSGDYRFTFTAKESKITEKGFETSVTDSKRYTYVFGPNETCRTAIDRFLKLAAKKSSANLDDIEDAFSVEKLTKEFFNKYKEQYEKFVCYLTGKRFVKQKGKWQEKIEHEPHAYMNSIFENDDKKARDFIKKSLGRLVFLYFLQKKGWLGCDKDNTDWKDGDQHFMQNYFDDCKDPTHFHSKFLVPLYFDCLNKKRENDLFTITQSRIPYLNGGLFEEEKLNTKIIDFPIEYWQQLFTFFAQFNFTIDENDPFEQEVGIDPEMLGHIFENLLEDNKDKGAFYTPKPIVEYMCKESLIQYLKTHLFPNSPLERGGSEADGVCDLPLEGGTKGGLAEADTKQSISFDSAQDDRNNSKIKALENFIRNHDYGDPESSENYIKNNAREIEQLLDDVKICDPAIGSGAFPMGLLQEIFWAKMTLDWTLNPAEVKKQIIQNSIYGVDIDSGAIDIARLRFWLSLIVDAEKPEPLPNLDYKIMQGNSLLESFEGIDLSKVMEDKLTVKTVIDGQQDLLDFANNDPQNQIIFSDDRKQKVQNLKDRYFSESDVETKKDIHKQIDEIVLKHIESCLEIHKDNLQLEIINLEKSINNKAKGKNKETREHLWDDSKDGKLLKKFQQEFELVDQKYKKLEELQYSTDRPFFLWHLYFSEIFNPPKKGESSAVAGEGGNGGFDIVIGNPPYIQLQKDYGLLASMYEDQDFETFARTGDIYSLFYEQGYNILSENGNLCYITSNKWMRANYGKKLRKYFAEKTQTIQLIDFGGYKVFESATVDTNILIFKNSPLLEGWHEVTGCSACTIRKGFTGQTDIAEYIKENSIFLSNLSEESWIISTKEEFAIKQKIEKIGTPLKDWDISINYGIKTGFNEAFIISGAKKDELITQDKKSAEIIKPILRGRDIKRYKAEFADLWLIFVPWHFPLHKDNSISGNSKIAEQAFQKDYPAIYNHLLRYKDKLSKRNKAETGIRYEWYALQRCAATYYEEFEKEKIVYPNMTQTPCFAYSNFEQYNNDKSFILTSEKKSIMYLLSVLNSKIVDFSLRYLCSGLGLKGLEVRKVFIENLPIPEILHEKQKPFENIVNQILQKKEQNEDTKHLENQIDLMVYKLYELSYEEVKIVDPEFDNIMNQEEYDNYEFE